MGTRSARGGSAPQSRQSRTNAFLRGKVVGAIDSAVTDDVAKNRRLSARRAMPLVADRGYIALLNDAVVVKVAWKHIEPAGVGGERSATDPDRDPVRSGDRPCQRDRISAATSTDFHWSVVDATSARDLDVSGSERYRVSERDLQLLDV